MNSEMLAGGQCGVLICFAVKEEAAPFLKTATSRRVQTLITGMGEKNATRALARFLERSQPRTVLSCGFAGALDPALAVGSVIFSHDSDFPFSSHLLSAGAKPATFYCAARVATSAREKAELRGQTGRDAVEMESSAIRRICQGRGLPSATVRVISDAADEDLPLDFNQLMTDNHELNFVKLFGTLILKPGRIPALIGLQRKTRLAAENLGRCLEALPV